MSFSLLRRTIASSAARLTPAHHLRRSLLDRFNGIRKSHTNVQQRDLIDKKKMIAESEKFLVERRYHIHKMIDDQEKLNTKIINFDNKITQAVEDLNFNLKDIKKVRLNDISGGVTCWFIGSCLIFTTFTVLLANTVVCIVKS